ncbi:MAG: hypothetical protein A3F91_03675 [Flavobacteria bacterium RIFCSPLOWO2_12_FULL_35_11]|nr:MAG: hypothetical protein A3F91_03675 [Flavobacteria bacterium RIFCSPLOWO2_12_FULL_35_11]
MFSKTVKDGRFKDGYRKIPAKNGCMSIIGFILIIAFFVKLGSSGSTEKPTVNNNTDSIKTDNPSEKSNDNEAKVVSPKHSSKKIKEAEELPSAVDTNVQVIVPQNTDPIKTDDTTKKKKGVFQKLFDKAGSKK